MSNLQIKNMPDEIHAELRRRARLDGCTIRDYLLRLITADQALPPRSEWFARVQARRPYRLAVSAADSVAQDRAERDIELARRSGLPDASAETP